MAPRRRVVVVSPGANLPLSPRTERTRRLIDAFDPVWDVSLLAGPNLGVGEARKHSVRWAAAGLTGRLAGTVLLDVYEPWSRRRFRRWEPDADLALLVGWPFSPLFMAGRLLAQRRIPYVVDVGDPFALTGGATRPVRGIARWRGKRLEAEMWHAAAGAIVTTPAQAAALREHFPRLRTLVRPNGHRSEDLTPEAVEPRAREAGAELRLVYFGGLEEIHADCRWFFERLVESGLWQSIVLHQYVGEASVELPVRLPEAVRFHRHEAVPWSEAMRVSRSYDLALAIGVRDGVQLPSKVVDYLTLPVRRLAVVESVGADAISDYLAGRRGWLIVDRCDPDLSGRVAEHARSDLAPGELAPPPEESWPRVTETIEAFLASVLDARRRSSSPVSDASAGRVSPPRR